MGVAKWYVERRPCVRAAKIPEDITGADDERLVAIAKWCYGQIVRMPNGRVVIQVDGQEVEPGQYLVYRGGKFEAWDVMSFDSHYEPLETT